MLYGAAAFNETGMPMIHGDAIQDVSDRTGHAIIFRAVGTQSTRLLEEGYAAKGFRIDTKSCDWGPMRGFVCVDPRLSKVGGDEAKVGDNQRYTVEALEGRIRHDAVGGLEVEALGHDAVLPDWMAGCKPVVISAARYAELIAGGLTGTTNSAGIIKGTSTDKTRRVRFPWALIPVARCMQTPGFATAVGDPPTGGYGVFVDYTNETVRFEQRVPTTIRAVKVLGYESVLGLTNPGTDEYGYRACVTGDYDLFAVWPPMQKLDPFGAGDWDTRVVDRYRQQHVASTTAHHHQHYRLGNITNRLNMVKVFLNTALIGRGGFPGGNLVHHSDEVGNPSPGLKKTLLESFPLLAFVPRDGWRRSGLTSSGMCVRNTLDFSTLVNHCQAQRIAPDLRPEWKNFTSV
jgi:hypothetical protein